MGNPRDYTSFTLLDHFSARALQPIESSMKNSDRSPLASSAGWFPRYGVVEFVQPPPVHSPVERGTDVGAGKSLRRG